MFGKVAVLIIHGIGAQKENFADETIKEINYWIINQDKDPKDIIWRSVYWADVLGPRQIKFMDDIIAEKNNDIDFIKLRRLIVSTLGDAAAYHNISGKGSVTYDLIHARITAHIKELYDNQLNQVPCPLIIMAHSFGGHIMSNHLWDCQKDDLLEVSDFEKMKYTAGIITFGCNIPLFTLTHVNLKPVEFPGINLTHTQKMNAKWLNFYDPDDVFGYPLKQLGKHYEFVEDININVGGVLTSWNPMSHNGYWTDKDFTRSAANLLAQFI